MNRILAIILPFVSLLACGSSGAEQASESAQTDGNTGATGTTGATVVESRKNDIPTGAQALIDAYPGIVIGYADNQIILSDSTRLTYDDGKEKDFVKKLDDCDIEDMFYTRYVVPSSSPEYLADAGRARNEALFKKIYGETSAAVSRNLVNVSWMGKNVKFTKINGAADQLRKVAEELAARPHLRKYLDCSGTFYWRTVRGADRLSAHSYGIAIDIGVNNSDYWLWRNPRAKETDKIKYSNRIPLEIVEIFQRHGFIWGGAWYHYDTMHFEYRPELLQYARLTSTSDKE